jgi:hypothetical protein
MSTSKNMSSSEQEEVETKNNTTTSGGVFYGNREGGNNNASNSGGPKRSRTESMEDLTRRQENKINKEKEGDVSKSRTSRGGQDDDVVSRRNDEEDQEKGGKETDAEVEDLVSDEDVEVEDKDEEVEDKDEEVEDKDVEVEEKEKDEEKNASVDAVDAGGVADSGPSNNIIVISDNQNNNNNSNNNNNNNNNITLGDIMGHKDTMKRLNETRKLILEGSYRNMEQSECTSLLRKLLRAIAYPIFGDSKSPDDFVNLVLTSYNTKPEEGGEDTAAVVIEDGNTANHKTFRILSAIHLVLRKRCTNYVRAYDMIVVLLMLSKLEISEQSKELKISQVMYVVSLSLLLLILTTTTTTTTTTTDTIIFDLGKIHFRLINKTKTNIAGV